MKKTDLPAAVDAEELHWVLPEAGAVLCYHRPGNGRPVLLLHSINGGPSAFEVSPFFDDESLLLGRPLYAPDLPGFGRSARSDRVYDPQFFARAILAMIDAIGEAAVDVVALSTTSEFAARAALLAPEAINSLVLVSPTGLTRRRETASKAGGRVYRVLRLPGLGAGLFRLLRSRRSVNFFLNLSFQDRAPQSMVDYACLTAAQPGAMYAPFYFLSTQMFTPDAVGDLYQPLQQPVMVLYDQDPNITFDYLDEMLDTCPNWRATRIPPTQGLPHFEQPALTRKALLAFWAADSTPE
ncbi:MAG: alpha/beta fold hydrolase [Congregibacter sp.]